MVISTKGRYGVRIMVELALAPSGELLPLREIAEKQEISKKYLESIVKMLIKRDLIQGLSGKGGGYRLSRPPQDYTLAEILESVEESLALVQCVSEDCQCTKMADCYTYPIWDCLQSFTDHYFRSFTLQDIIEKQPIEDKFTAMLASMQHCHETKGETL